MANRRLLYPLDLEPIYRLRQEHYCLSFNHIIDEVTYFWDTPDFDFTPEYLIVTTSGFFIESLCFANVRVIENCDADVYYRANWDRLERMGQLDRVRLPSVPMTPANKYSFRVGQHIRVKPREFRGAFIGKRMWREYPESSRDDFSLR
jgi:hypothetical protein